MRLSELLACAGISPVSAEGDAEVSSVATDSRRCRKGCCFVAVPGPDTDGHAYIPEALQAGAAAIVCQDDASLPPGAPRAVVADTRAAAGPLAQAVRGWPARKLTKLAVTGTNGKTTVAMLARAALEAAGHRTGLVGTIHYRVGEKVTPLPANTTPGADELAALTDEMVSAGCTHVVMEASSHALDQKRTDGMEFQAGIFTNLSGDHLDYHGTMEQYLLAKRRLFESLPREATAVVNRDDPAGERMADAAKGRVLWYGLSDSADVRGRIESIDASGSRFVLCFGEFEQPVSTPLIGRHNVMNCLAAAAGCLAIGCDFATVAGALETVGRIPGRLERVPVEAPYDVFVDYAHTDDALRNVLAALAPLKAGKLVVVFGCGGDRDRTKRPRMARVAEEFADRIVITSDNPRSENPDSIIEEIAAGLGDAGRRRSEVQPDRRSAIARAVEFVRAGDLVLIAGKGHEEYQLVGTKRLHFDDVEVAAEIIRRKEGTA